MNVIYSITNRTYSVVRGILILALGVALLLWPESMLNIIVKLIAAFLIAAGLVTLYFTSSAKKEEEKRGEKSILSAFAILNIAVYLSFGILIFIFPSFFVSILVFLFGAILLLLGIGQLVNLFLSGRHTKLSGYLYIVPVVVTICGIILFFQPFTAKNVLTMFFGGCLAGYGATELLSAWVLRNVKFDRGGKFVVKPAEVEEVAYEDLNK